MNETEHERELRRRNVRLALLLGALAGGVMLATIVLWTVTSG